MSAPRKGVAFGWFSPNKKAVIIRRITGEADGRATLEDLGIICYTQDLDLLREGKLTKRDGSPRKSVIFYPETKPKPRE